MTARLLLHDETDVADICQETLLRAHRDLSQLRDPSRFGSWIIGIARHVAIDVVRRRQRRRTMPLDDQTCEQLIDVTTTAHDVFMGGELTRQVRTGLGQLSSRDAALIVMVGELGFTVTEVAEALNLTANAAKVAIHRARRRLAEQLTA